MEVNLDDFRRHFELLSDETLLSTSRDELVEGARVCYDEEVERRGLNATETSEAVEETPVAEPVSVEELVAIATYNIPEEASLARGLLESAGIPYRLNNEYSPLGGIELRLMVPKVYQDEAVEILETELSEEELAAQAEAAGLFEEEAAESEQE